MTSPAIAYEPLEVNDECDICGADIGPSSLFSWHFAEEDCRAVREPLIGPTIIRPTAAPADA